MRIGTWNVEYAAGAEKNAHRLEVLRSNPADIWMLTETHDDLDLSSTHAAVHTLQRPTGRAGGRWASIWSKYPIEREIEVRDPVRTCAAILRTLAGPLMVFATVLPLAQRPWRSPAGGQGVQLV